MLNPNRARSLRILVLGFIVRGPVGGMAWHHLQYVAGLARLGHDVYFLEDSGDWPSCYDPTTHITDTDPAYGLRFAEQAFGRLGLQERWGYFDAHRQEWRGPVAGAWAELCATADVLVNVSGVNPIRPWLEQVPARVFVDTDPGFTQVRHLRDPERARLAGMHTCYVTFGSNIGQPGCRIPADGFPWQATRQPVVLDLWPSTPADAQSRFTTVMQWDSYQALDHDGLRLGMKAESFNPYLTLPTLTAERLELALGSPKAPRKELVANGWRLVDPMAVSHDPWTYRRYLQRSKGEFAVAKHGYVSTHSGWFSERSAAYLACGRPVVVQDTGFRAWLQADLGVVSFQSPEEALAGLESVAAEYEKHSGAARDICAAHFDSRMVLSQLLERAMSSPAKAGSQRQPADRPAAGAD